MGSSRLLCSEGSLLLSGEDRLFAAHLLVIWKGGICLPLLNLVAGMVGNLKRLEKLWYLSHLELFLDRKAHDMQLFVSVLFLCPCCRGSARLTSTFWQVFSASL